METLHALVFCDRPLFPLRKSLAALFTFPRFPSVELSELLMYGRSPHNRRFCRSWSTSLTGSLLTLPTLRVSLTLLWRLLETSLLLLLKHIVLIKISRIINWPVSIVTPAPLASLLGEWTRLLMCASLTFAFSRTDAQRFYLEVNIFRTSSK